MKWWMCSLIIMVSTAAQARVVSYPGGLMPMAEVSEDHATASMLYSPSAWYSYGLSSTYHHDTNAWTHLAEANWLAYRHNAKSSQANLYLRGGAGVSERAGVTRPAGMVGMIADWEDRRYMVAYQNSYSIDDHDVMKSSFMQRARVGIAPYKAPYEAWQPWVILQLDHEPTDDTPLEVGPVFRAFKGPILGEVGITNRGNIFTALHLQF